MLQGSYLSKRFFRRCTRVRNFTSFAVALLVVLAATAPSARAAFTITLQQVGSDVVASGTGSLNLSALTANVSGGVTAAVEPDLARVILATGSFFAYPGLSGPTSFGAAGPTNATSFTGSVVGVEGASESLVLSQDYVSGTPITSSATFANATLSSLGFSPTTFIDTYTWGSGPTADSLTVIAPEPASAAVLGVATVGLIARRRRV